MSSRRSAASPRRSPTTEASSTSGCCAVRRDPGRPGQAWSGRSSGHPHDQRRRGSAYPREHLEAALPSLQLLLPQRWCRENPCLGVRRPRIHPSSDIRFLDKDELEALVEAIDVNRLPFGAIDRAIVLTAAMTGMRQGELLALHWFDVNWNVKRIRVRRNYVRGHMGTPKSRSGERSVPLSTRVATELTRLRTRSRFRDDEDLVFANPLTGGALDHASLLRRFKKALKAAGVRAARFHDLRHTFGTRMAASPHVAMRQIQEWMGHWDYRTTLIYADYETG